MCEVDGQYGSQVLQQKGATRMGTTESKSKLDDPGTLSSRARCGRRKCGVVGENENWVSKKQDREKR